MLRPNDRQMEVKAMLALAEMEAPMWVQLPRLIEVTKAVQSTRMDPYIRKVREDVCPNCRALPDGHCEARDEGHCALDAYLLVIVQTIEDFLAERVGAVSRDNSRLTSPLLCRGDAELASLSGSVH